MSFISIGQIRLEIGWFSLLRCLFLFFVCLFFVSFYCLFLLCFALTGVKVTQEWRMIFLCITYNLFWSFYEHQHRHKPGKHQSISLFSILDKVMSVPRFFQINRGKINYQTEAYTEKKPNLYLQKRNANIHTKRKKKKSQR